MIKQQLEVHDTATTDNHYRHSELSSPSISQKVTT